jgi:hypothetical protein
VLRERAHRAADKERLAQWLHGCNQRSQVATALTVWRWVQHRGRRRMRAVCMLRCSHGALSPTPPPPPRDSGRVFGVALGHPMVCSLIHRIAGQRMQNSCARVASVLWGPTGRRVLRAWQSWVDLRAVLRDAVAFTASQAIVRRRRRALLTDAVQAWRAALRLEAALMALAIRTSPAAHAWCGWRERMRWAACRRTHAATVTAAVMVRQQSGLASSRATNERFRRSTMIMERHASGATGRATGRARLMDLRWMYVRRRCDTRALVVAAATSVKRRCVRGWAAVRARTHAVQQKRAVWFVRLLRAWGVHTGSELRRRRMLAAMAVRRWRRWAWQRWLAAVADRAWADRVAIRAARRRHARVLSVWAAAAAAGREALDRDSTAVASAARVLLRALTRRALLTWWSATDASTTLRRRCAHLAARLRANSVESTMARWATWAVQTAAQRRRVRRAVQIITRRLLMACVRSWAAAAGARRRQAAAEARLRLSVAVRRVALALDGWANVAARWLRARGLLRAIAVRREAAAAAAAWRAWGVGCEAVQRRRWEWTRAVRMGDRGCVGRAWRSWRGCVDDGDRLRRVVRRLRRSSAGRRLRAWAAAVVSSHVSLTLT